LAVALVLAGYIVISRAFAYGGRTPQFEAASGLLIVLIGAYLLWAAFNRRHDEQTDGRALAVATGMIPCPLTTFVLTFALTEGVLAFGLLVTAAMAVGMVITIGGVALIAALSRENGFWVYSLAVRAGDIASDWAWKLEAQRWCFFLASQHLSNRRDYSALSWRLGKYCGG
jgi:ABC-type nickel/cobalt efflux system permease component RcnA